MGSARLAALGLGLLTPPGTYLAAVTANDGTTSDSQYFLWTVNPYIDLANPGTQATTAGQPVSLTLSATDAAGDTMTYAAFGLPTGLSFNPTSGLISGTPAAPGTYSVTVEAAVPGYSDSVAFTWGITSPITFPTPPGARPLTKARACP